MAISFKPILQGTKTDDICNYFEKHSDSYNLTVTGATSDDQKVLLIDEDNLWYYIVNEDEKNVGFLMLAIDGPYSNLRSFIELEIGIFDEDLEQGYGQESMDEFLREINKMLPNIDLRYSTLKALVYQKNKYRDAIVSILDNIEKEIKRKKNYRNNDFIKTEDDKLIEYSINCMCLIEEN